MKRAVLILMAMRPIEPPDIPIKGSEWPSAQTNVFAGLCSSIFYAGYEVESTSRTVGKIKSPPGTVYAEAANFPQPRLAVEIPAVVYASAHQRPTV